MNDLSFSPRRSASISLTALTLAAFSALAGCQNAGGAAVKASATACADYAKAICKEAGDESDTCKSVKSATELMPAEACAVAQTKIADATKKLGEKRKKCDELSDKLCKALGEATATCTMVKTQTKTFQPERCDMMMQHYDEVLADLQRQEAKNKPLTPEVQAKMATTDGPAFGPTTSKVTIVEFSDFQCPFCSRAATVADKVKEKYGDKVRFVFRQFPLSFHQNAKGAAEAALAANAQGKFWEFHDKLFANQDKLDRASLEGFAKEVGLDVNKFKKALDDKSFTATVDSDLKLGEEVAVDGTPTMFLNGARVANPTDFDSLAQQIDAALAGS